MGYPANEAVDVEDCDLCIVGAGICGLNFLFSASQYMTKESKIVLVDRRSRVGGMWNDTYDYVRLHQPHPVFTVGNFSWSLGKERSHLATRQEILDHFQQCVERLRERVTLVERYGYIYESHDEIPLPGGYGAEVRCRPVTSGGRPLLIRAPHVAKAFGMRVPKPQPLALSSEKVVSISPLDLDVMERDGAAKPVYIVGGGKTGMDTAQTILARFPGREVNMVIGKGTVFWNRNQVFPSGLKRWWGGQMVMPAFMDLALRFDGTNEEEVHEHLKRTYTLGINDRCDDFLSALLSEEENALITEGVNEVIEDYLVDVVDEADRPVMKLRSGEERPIAPGSHVVGCTGALLRERHSYEPYVSESGVTVSIQSTSSVYGFQSFAGYWLGQLLYLGKILDVPLYALNNERLFAKDKKAFTFAWITQLLYNTILIMDAVPARALRDCGLNFDNWYPPYRQLPVLLKMKLRGRSYLRHFRSSLDRVCQRMQIEGGPLVGRRARPSADGAD